MSPAESLASREYIDKELADGKIRPSDSPVAARGFFVKRGDGRLRWVVDYTEINEITENDRFPMPMQDDLLEKLMEAKWYTHFDLRNGFNNIRIAEGDEWKTTFRTRWGSYEWNVMPFGLTNAPAAWSRFINDVLKDMIDVFVIVYLDDILIYSDDPASHREHIRKVLERL